MADAVKIENLEAELESVGNAIDVNHDREVSLDELMLLLEQKHSAIPRLVAKKILEEIAGSDGKAQIAEFDAYVSKIHRSSQLEAFWSVGRGLLFDYVFWLGAVSFFVPGPLGVGNCCLWRDSASAETKWNVSKAMIVMWAYACVVFAKCTADAEVVRFNKTESAKLSLRNAATRAKNEEVPKGATFREQLSSWLGLHNIAMTDKVLDVALSSAKPRIANLSDFLTWAKELKPCSTAQMRYEVALALINSLGWWSMVVGFFVGCVLWVPVNFVLVDAEESNYLNQTALVLFAFGYFGFQYLATVGYLANYDRIEDGREAVRAWSRSHDFDTAAGEDHQLQPTELLDQIRETNVAISDAALKFVFNEMDTANDNTLTRQEFNTYLFGKLDDGRQYMSRTGYILNKTFTSCGSLANVIGIIACAVGLVKANSPESVHAQAMGNWASILFFFSGFASFYMVFDTKMEAFLVNEKIKLDLKNSLNLNLKLLSAKADSN
jgi:Ca2+-binding EF-hand superfamily protein